MKGKGKGREGKGEPALFLFKFTPLSSTKYASPFQGQIVCFKTVLM